MKNSIWMVLALSLSRLAFAGGASDFEVRCVPQVSPQGTELVVEVLRDTTTAKITYEVIREGIPQQTLTYKVKKSLSADLNILTFRGQDAKTKFLLRVDEGAGTGELTAQFKDQKIAEKNLSCVVQEFEHHLGVTFSNL